MIILDHPYVSQILEDTIAQNNYGVLNNIAAEELTSRKDLQLLNDEAFTKAIRNQKVPLLYTNSENSIEWITQNLGFTRLPELILIFKNKARFRERIKSMYPDFFFKEVSFDQLDQLSSQALPFPFIIKPSVGFFSIGVHVVNNPEEWGKVVAKLKAEIGSLGHNFPGEVINVSNFILEEIIPGDEFAVDVYYDRNGEPVVLNILKHLFSSAEDVSDRVYITSKQIIEEHLESFTQFLSKMGDLIELRGFPMHIEFRVDSNNYIIPIEVNPMRFAGWCVTDIAWYAFGINVYEYFFEQKQPDWEAILKDKNDDIYSMVVADLPKDIPADNIKEIDYEKFRTYFEDPLELRKIDYKKHGVFAFQFARTSYKNRKLLEDILQSDLKEFLIL
ncbi:ATP-grasp domain-containing protein [Marinilabilia salmonicolor]|uniref:ATP-grasp domain-containing protein n=1 Tax=Marinilabilia salmonicolor TaxID=989 RepID=A0A368UWK0_9BACT|nr:ATP-grasp domain-containing protein [Marinilabilia salmonicolor]RCW33238.1 ATP-grasp domain-containing protein [Marinilabilia salmonicolor]